MDPKFWISVSVTFPVHEECGHHARVLALISTAGKKHFYRCPSSNEMKHYQWCGILCKFNLPHHKEVGTLGVATPPRLPHLFVENDGRPSITLTEPPPTKCKFFLPGLVLIIMMRSRSCHQSSKNPKANHVEVLLLEAPPPPHSRRPWRVNSHWPLADLIAAVLLVSTILLRVSNSHVVIEVRTASSSSSSSS